MITLIIRVLAELTSEVYFFKGNSQIVRLINSFRKLE